MAKKKKSAADKSGSGKQRGGEPGASAPPPISGVELAERAIAPKAEHEEIEEHLKQLDPEQAEMFVRILEITMRRRRAMLFGYLGALVAVLAGMMWALYKYGTHEPGTFIGWVFLIPPAAAGLIIFAVGRWTKRIK